MIQLQRVYDAEKRTKSEGTRFLVERLWPRGIRKEFLYSSHDAERNNAAALKTDLIKTRQIVRESQTREHLRRRQPAKNAEAAAGR